MKRPKPNSPETNLISGTVLFAASGAYTTNYAVVTPPYALNRGDTVAVSIDDNVAGAPNAYAGYLIPIGTIAPNGDIKIWLNNPAAAPVAMPDTRVNYIVFPASGTYSPP
jgi:hypothetical protein